MNLRLIKRIKSQSVEKISTDWLSFDRNLSEKFLPYPIHCSNRRSHGHLLR